MRSKRLNKIAHNLLLSSLKLQKDQTVVITAYHEAKPLLVELACVCKEHQINVYFELLDDTLSRLMTECNSEAYWQSFASRMINFYHDVDAFLMLDSSNEVEGSKLGDKLVKKRQILSKLSDEIIKKEWLVALYPSELVAYQFNMVHEDFEEFWYQVSSFDYQKLEQASQPLKELLLKTNQVRIVAPNTDITFSIKDIDVVICSGRHNIPDGEVYTAPVKDSVYGTITYNIPSKYSGHNHQNVSLTFENGRIVSFTGDNPQLLEKIFNTDEGSRYIGEFAIGINPFITKGVGNILFDEKMAGSIHFSPGACYDRASNGNKSSNHWDLVLSQRPEHGGGQIYFDDVLVRDNGLFVLDQLKCLNPEELING